MVLENELVAMFEYISGKGSEYFAVRNSYSKKLASVTRRHPFAILHNVPVAVFFFPKHCTLCVEAMLGGRLLSMRVLVFVSETRASKLSRCLFWPLG